MISWRQVIWIGFLLCLHLSASAQSSLSQTPQELRHYKRSTIYNFDGSKRNIVFQAEGRIWQADPTSGQPPTEEASALPFEVAVAFDSGGDIYITDFSSDPVSVTNSATYDMLPAWSPDGTQIAFLSSDSYRTWNESHLNVITLATGEVRSLSELTFSSETTLTWSPDGQYIAATLGTIFIVNVETGDNWRLPVDCGTCSVNWLADSSGLIFESKGEIFRIDVDGEHLQQITHSPPNAYRPALSPVSDKVVFASSYEGIPGLYSVGLDKLEINRVVDLSGYNVIPHYWSPDGQFIAFGVSPAYGSDVIVPGGGDVYVINKDGTDMRVVTGGGSDSLVGWTDDSQHVIYYEGEPSSAGGAYFAVNISDLTQIRLSGEIMERMCSYSNCHNFTIRP